MSENSEFTPPEITDVDIHWASNLLRLSSKAFFGEDGNDPRQHVLKSMDSVDVAACPGSGKTTLLVAKLAILAEKWQYRSRGICVISHTNVARSEIETRLGNTTTGRRLLSYPHYIGTIHSFVNEFLAIPWLRSRGYPIKMIDTEICEMRRWNKLDSKWRYSLEKKYVDKSNIRILDADFNLAKKNGPLPFQSQTDTYRNLRDTCKETSMEGYHCYDDMFLWAHDLMDKIPDVVHVIRDRFPLLFIDEAQDNSEVQSEILHRIFLKGRSTVIRQRLGDVNQAIFDFEGAQEATTDKYPIDTIIKDLPNSHRFGPNIARLADPLGLESYPSCLVGQGPKTSLASGLSEGSHTIFLFNKDSISKVLDAYAKLLVETFSQRELLNGTFTAVGQRHKRPNKEECPNCIYDRCQKFPHHVGHYWPCYDPELTSREAKPQTFVQYVFAGIEKAKLTGEAYQAVEKISEGILRLAGMIQPETTIHHRKHPHRYILQLLQESTTARDCYRIMIVRFAVKQKPPTKETWDSRWCSVVGKIAEAIAGAPLSGDEAEQFLMWKYSFNDKMAITSTLMSRDNIYKYPGDDPKVHILVGSVHSIKGETHTATLVLDTYWYGHEGKHNLELILPWLTGTKRGRSRSEKRQQDRLKIHYVAMTRPTHLLCLAMRRSTLEDGNGSLDEDKVQKLQSHGWSIREI